mgnify:CR=1 FL=1
MSMDRITLTWNEFRKMHKGIPSKQISAKWKQYKAGEYDVTVINEVPRSNEEKKQLKRINTSVKQKSTLHFITRGIL